MSISFFLVLLLFVCLHECNGRTFGFVRHHSAMDSQLSITKENDEKVNPGSVSVQADRRKVVADAAGTQNENKVQEKNRKSKNEESGGSRRKRKKQESAGFTLDYLPPRTHPPVHN